MYHLTFLLSIFLVCAQETESQEESEEGDAISNPHPKNPAVPQNPDGYLGKLHKHQMASSSKCLEGYRTEPSSSRTPIFPFYPALLQHLHSHRSAFRRQKRVNNGFLRSPKGDPLATNAFHLDAISPFNHNEEIFHLAGWEITTTQRILLKGTEVAIILSTIPLTDEEMGGSEVG